MTSFVTILLLWLFGAGLRIPILAVPPIISIIQSDLQLSGTEIGILTGLPVVLFAAAALPGSLFIARAGALRTLLFGLLVTAAGGALRGVSQTTASLYLTTALMGIGIAIMQPAMPAIVRQWTPTRIGLATAIYTNGLIVGEIVPVVLTIPLILPIVGGSWRLDLAAWSIPLVAIAVLAALLAPKPPSMDGPYPAAPARWWPSWDDPVVWRIGLVFTSVNSVYFSTNTFLPALLNSTGRPGLVSGALGMLNFAQLPASLLIVAIGGRIERRIWPYIAAGCSMMLCIIGIVSSGGVWTLLWAGLLGFSCAWALPLGLALPPLLMRPPDVARTSAAMFAISYGLAMLVSVIAGAVWDLSGKPIFAFLPIGISVLPLLLLTPAIRFHRD